METPRTLCELFQLSLVRHPRPRALLHKRDGAWVPVSSAAFGARVQNVAMGLRALGVQAGDRVAIVSENRLEWALADYALLHCGAVPVPIYPTLQPAGVQALLADAGATAALVANPEQLSKLGGPGASASVRLAVLFDGEPPAPSGREVLRLEDAESRGAADFDPGVFERAWRAVQAGDVATLIYTSGTSGKPKGVVLTHANLIANIEALLRRVPLHAGDTCLSFLPLSHVLERTCGHFLMWHIGATIAYAESVDAVPHNLAEVRPTVLISVPRLYEKMNARIRAAVEEAPAVRRSLFLWAQRKGRDRVQREQEGRAVPPLLRLECRIADRLVFAKLRERLGGRVRVLVSGGAPLSQPIGEFFYAAGLPILEGYGLTETSPVLCVNPLDKPRIGTVGPPLDNVEVRIADTGEILARGPSVMSGYWHDPEATAEAIRDGWFHTGDIGEFDATGSLRITDRLKDLLVTAGGKKVAPQPIEARLKAFQHLTEVVLVGDHRKFVSAVVFPNFHNLEHWADVHGVRAPSRAELVQSPQVLELFAAYFTRVNHDLAPFERIKRFRLVDRELHHASEELTPSMKVRRAVVARTFADLIESMYDEPPGPGVGTPSTEDAA